MSGDCALDGLTVLVARPARREDDFSARLAVLGARVHRLPAMAIEPLDTPESRALLAMVSDFDKVVVVSANAASLALARLDSAALRERGPAWFAVGAGSAAPLHEAGIAVGCPVDDATSEGLLALPAFAEVAGQQVLIIRGEGGRDVLRAGLVARGARVTFCELYRRVVDTSHRAQVQSLLESKTLDLVVTHSADVLACFLAQVAGSDRALMERTAVLVPSDRAAEMAWQAGFGEVIRAASALPSAMVDAAVGWYTSLQ
ncbi:MAG: uroporphyrinogen-III synthase [Porticoccaceae bacterium]|nr:uroporphyrinogen-III synthase [Porticoccaceae bacterium]